MQPIFQKIASRSLWWRPLLMTLAFSGLTACGLFGDKEEELPEYYAAKEVPALELPEGFDRPIGTGALLIAAPQAPLPEREMKTVPPRVSSDSGGKPGNTSIRWSAEGVYLWVKDTPESVQRRLGFAIKRAGMSVRETSTDGIYEFEYWHQPPKQDEGFFSKLAFWRDDGPNYSGTYQIITQPDLEDTRVYIKNVDGTDSDPDAAEHLLAIFSERLG